MTTTTLNYIQQEITRIGYPMCVLIGNIGGAIGLFVFLQKRMRKNPYGLFIIVYMIANILYVNFTILLQALSALFQINPSAQSSTFCRIEYYISFVLAVIPSYLLAMASIDRSFASSRNVHIRSRSTKRFAALMIGIICSFWIVFHVQAFFTADLELIGNLGFVCTFRLGISTIFAAYYNLICIGIIPPLLMIGFGIQILMNIRQNHVNRTNLRNNRRSLILLLIIQVAIYLCLRLPASFYLIYKQITSVYQQTSNQIIIGQFIQSTAYFCQFMQVSISPLLNLITKTFRKELKRALNRIRRRNNRLHVTGSIDMQRTGRHLN